jgi:UrcA family protein
MSRSVRLGLVAAIGIIAASQSALGASRVERVEVGRVTVSYSDLDLSARGDARVMLTRLQHAAYKACGGDARMHPDYNLMWQHVDKAYQDCRNDAVSKAVVAVDAPLLTEVYQGEETQRLARAAPR